MPWAGAGCAEASMCVQATATRAARGEQRRAPLFRPQLLWKAVRQALQRLDVEGPRGPARPRPRGTSACVHTGTHVSAPAAASFTTHISTDC